MEQTNLVVTPDGKTWDEVTRDTSYIGNIVVKGGTNTIYNNSTFVIFDDWRGNVANIGEQGNKDFAIAYDRQYCLKAGQYGIHAMTIGLNNTAQEHSQIYVNGTLMKGGHGTAAGYSQSHVLAYTHLKRGDYVQIKGHWYPNHEHSTYWIERI